jgi:hypothetical protein
VNGWIRLHRQIIESPVFADAELLKLWLWILAKASTKERHVSMSIGRCRKIVTIQAGQCVVGRVKSAEALDWKPSTFRNRLQKLNEMGMVKIEVDTHWSVVSVTKWLEYQSRNSEERTTKGQPKDSLRTTKGQPKDTNKKVKNCKKVEKVEKEETNTTSVDESLLSWIDFWNSLKSKNLVHREVSKKPSEGVQTAWRRVQSSEVLQELLADKDTLERKIRDQPFLKGAWFTLPKLLGARNKEKEFFVRKILDGCYVSTNQKPTANQGPGVNYDSTWDPSNAEF